MQGVGQQAVSEQRAPKDAVGRSVRWHRGIDGRLTRCDSASSGTESDSKSQHEPSAKRRREQHEKNMHLLENIPSTALGLEALPEDVISHVFSYLPFYESLSLARVSKTWFRASGSPQAFINVDFSWVDNAVQRAPGECIDLLGECYMLPPKRSGKLADYLQPRAGSLKSVCLGLVGPNSTRKGMASPSQLLALVSSCSNLRRLYLFHPESGCGLSLKSQVGILQAAAD
jgi:hypothetical protein